LYASPAKNTPQLIEIPPRAPESGTRMEEREKNAMCDPTIRLTLKRLTLFTNMVYSNEDIFFEIVTFFIR
jgi:hypothetical protein